MDESPLERVRREAVINRAFSPSAPINKLDLFAGRFAMVKDISRAVSTRGQHVVLFGERGVGKTSLASVTSELMYEPLAGVGYICKSYNCASTDTFDSIMRNVFRRIEIETTEWSMGILQRESKSLTNLEELYRGLRGDKPVSPDDVLYLFEHLKDTCIIIIDEVDRIREVETMTLLADLIKALSDQTTATIRDLTLVLVGVADTVDDLIGQHPSVERAVVQIRMPRMELLELQQILDKALGPIGMTIKPTAKIRIAEMSKGLPHYAHLLGLEAALHAYRSGRSEIEDSDVTPAIKAAVGKANQSIQNAYHNAVSSNQTTHIFDKVLLACALSSTDEFGYFSAREVRSPLSIIMGRPYDIPNFSGHLGKFISASRGGVLQRIGESKRYKYRFRDPLMQPYVVLSGLAKGIITEQILDRIVKEVISEDT